MTTTETGPDHTTLQTPANYTANRAILATEQALETAKAAQASGRPAQAMAILWMLAFRDLQFLEDHRQAGGSFNAR